jgi:hypothetical protein
MGIDFFAESPVLQSLRPVIEGSRNVRTNEDAIERVASWMAYEEFGIPGGLMAHGDMGRDVDSLTDMILLANSLNFAYTDFDTSVKFEVWYEGRRHVDADGMGAAFHREWKAGRPILTGQWMRDLTRGELAEVFAGNIEIPMLDERVAVLNKVGQVLVDRFDGSFHNWVKTCDRAVYADGNGLLERLAIDFPRFNDVSTYDGHEVKFFKLGQLGLWGLHSMWVTLGEPGLRDLHRMSAFADYIVPVALRVMGVMEYSDDLDDRINRGVEIPRDSLDEIEIRAHALHGTALLTQALNRRRPDDLQLVIPQVDYRLWSRYHVTHWPHHLTRTIMY